MRAVGTPGGRGFLISLLQTMGSDQDSQAERDCSSQELINRLIYLQDAVAVFPIAPGIITVTSHLQRQKQQ